MSAQTSYNFFGKKALAGGIADLAPYAIDTFLNEEDTGDMKFGFGVVQGTKPGINAAIPTSGSDVFEGITVNNLTTEQGMDGGVVIRNGAALGVMRYGKVWAQAVDASSADKIAYGDAVYLIVSGTNAGKLTNDSSGTLAVKGVFRSAIDNGVALVELFNANAEVAAYTLPAASASVLGGVKVGTGLTVAEDGTLSVSAE